MRFTPRRSLIAAAIATTAVFALGACSTPAPAPADDGPITLRVTWWGSDSRNAATTAALDLYEEKNPNVTIEAEFLPFDGYFEKLSTLAAADDLPDLMAQQYAQFPQYVSRGALLALDEFEPDVLDLSQLDSGAQSQGVVDGVRYAVPAGANTQAVAVDPAIFEAAGIEVPSADWTWSDFAEVSRALAASGAITYGSNDPAVSDQIFDLWLTQQGKAFYNADGELGFDEGDLEDFWSFFADLRGASALPPADVTAETTGDVNTYPLVRGLAAMDFGYIALLPGLTTAAGRELVALPYPSADKGGDPGQYLIGTGITWAGAANSEHPRQVADLINFLVNDPEAVALLGLERSVPLNQPSRDVLLEGELTEPQQVVVNFVADVAAGDLATESVFYNKPPRAASEITALFKEAANTVSYGRDTIENAATQFITDANDVLERDR